jgi:hypothetical protein
MRHALDDRTLLSVRWGNGEEQRADRLVIDARPGRILETEDELTRVLRTLTDPVRLVPVLDLWLAWRLPGMVRGDERIAWLSLVRAIDLAGSPTLRDIRTLGALQLAVQSDLRREADAYAHTPAPPSGPATPHASPGELEERYLDADLSLLECNARVLALARDASSAPIRRLEYLAIVASNLDEFFMVRVGALKRALLSSDERGLTGEVHAARLDAVRLRANALHISVFREICGVVRPELEAHGFRLRRWGDLDVAERERLAALFEREILPRLYPLASGPPRCAWWPRRWSNARSCRSFGSRSIATCRPTSARG